jgi:drug/metabolite transporter (DMT)-like permease
VLLGLGAALAAAVVFGVATVLQAIGARRVPTASGLDPRVLLRLLREPVFVGAILLNGVGFLLHLAAIRLLPLYLAQAGISASLVVTAVLAVRLFGDRLVPVEWAAVAAVWAGLALLTTASGPIGQVGAGTAFVVGLFVALGVITLVGLATSRAQHQVVPAALGLLAGLAFGADSIAVRMVPDLSPLQLWHAAPAYAFLISATLGFLLYSIALQRGAVAAATAPMIVAQTVAPAAVGVLLLGDQVRSGYYPVAVAGLVLTTAGAARLARFEGAPRPDPVRD